MWPTGQIRGLIMVAAKCVSGINKGAGPTKQLDTNGKGTGREPTYTLHPKIQFVMLRSENNLQFEKLGDGKVT
jgi:hypothetical protein